MAGTKLPQFQTTDRDFQLMQSTWSSAINPVLTNPTNNCTVIKNVSLQTGSNTINTLIGRPIQGWSIVRKRAAADIYDTQDSNPTPQITLVLVSSAPCVVDLMIF